MDVCQETKPGGDEEGRGVLRGVNRRLRTAVEGVNPGQPGQPASTEGLHPPPPPLPPALSLSPPDFCSPLLQMLVSRPSFPYFCKVVFISREETQRIIWGGKRRRSEVRGTPLTLRRARACVCVCVSADRENNRLEESAANRC